MNNNAILRWLSLLSPHIGENRKDIDEILGKSLVCGTKATPYVCQPVCGGVLEEDEVLRHDPLFGFIFI